MTPKYRYSYLAVAVCAVMAYNNAAFSQSIPDCISASSDPDRDGWGWENSQSCKVRGGNDNGGSPVCEDGDDTDPDDDGWGWENGQSCLVMDDGSDDNDHDDKEEQEFEETHLYFELNNTDGDLGFHGLIDGENWITLEIDNPDGEELFDIKLDNQLRVQSLTELFFESTEPNFDDLAPAIFFERFMEGEYEVEGNMADGGELSSTATVTHLIPAPPANLTINGQPLPDGCDGDIPLASEPVTISWDPVTMSHPSLGRTGESVDVSSYEVVIERVEPDNVKFTHQLPAGQTSLQVNSVLAQSGDEIKMEVLVREESGNQTATETCFILQ